MAQSYIGQIRMFAGNFPPSGWMFCEGQLLSIAENDILFQLIGTTYGGDGQSTFALPDLRGRLPLHMGNNGGSAFAQGQSLGVETVTLTANQIPAHSHTVYATSAAGTALSASGTYLAASAAQNAGYATTSNATAAATIVSTTGGNQPHSNMQPYLCVSFIISLFGVFPSP
jgi:microcystin-dependent protein